MRYTPTLTGDAGRGCGPTSSYSRAGAADPPRRTRGPGLRTHLVVLAVDERQLELELGGVDAEHSRLALAVQAVHAVALDARDVDGQVERADDAVVPATAAARI